MLKSSDLEQRPLDPGDLGSMQSVSGDAGKPSRYVKFRYFADGVMSGTVVRVDRIQPKHADVNGFSVDMAQSVASKAGTVCQWMHFTPGLEPTCATWGSAAPGSANAGGAYRTLKSSEVTTPLTADDTEPVRPGKPDTSEWGGSVAKFRYFVDGKDYGVAIIIDTTPAGHSDVDAFSASTAASIAATAGTVCQWGYCTTERPDPPTWLSDMPRRTHPESV